MRRSDVICLLFILALAFPVNAQEQGAEALKITEGGYEYKQYTVVQGDTLWDVSSKELNNPFQWPIIWSENSWIKHPDRIYPGQTIKIPAGIKTMEEKAIETIVVTEPKEEVFVAIEKAVEAKPKKEVKKQEVKKEETEKIEAVKKSYLVDKNILLYAGYITIAPPYKGEITGAPRGGKYFGLNEEVYIRPMGDVKIGDMFYAIRKGVDKVKHPKSGVNMGWLVEIIGVLRIDGIEADGVRAKIIRSFMEIALGDHLDNYYDIDLPFVIGEPKKPDLKGCVVASKQMRLLSGIHDIVYIDKGIKDGLKPGDVLMTVAPGSKARQNGVIQVISPKDTTSAAIILNSLFGVRPGDEIAGIK